MIGSIFGSVFKRLLGPIFGSLFRPLAVIFHSFFGSIFGPSFLKALGLQNGVLGLSWARLGPLQDPKNELLPRRNGYF